MKCHVFSKSCIKTLTFGILILLYDVYGVLLLKWF